MLIELILSFLCRFGDENATAFEVALLREAGFSTNEGVKCEWGMDVTLSSMNLGERCNRYGGPLQPIFRNTTPPWSTQCGIRMFSLFITNHYRDHLGFTYES